MKSHTRLLANIAAISMIATLTGCKENVETNDFFNKEEIITIERKEEKIIKKDKEILLKEYLYDEFIDYEFVIKKYLDLDYEDREQYRNEYLRAIYMKMLNSNVDMNVYFEELNILTVLQQFPMCMDFEAFNEIFKNLIALDPECLSVVDTYSEFAFFVHELTCKEVHTLDEFGEYSCKKLEEDYKLLLA